MGVLSLNLHLSNGGFQKLVKKNCLQLVSISHTLPAINWLNIPIGPCGILKNSIFIYYFRMRERKTITLNLDVINIDIV
jgi:hypothetical protein